MNLATIIEMFFGGPGSGCHGPNCGRRASRGNVDKDTNLFDTANGNYLVLPNGDVVRGTEWAQHDDLANKVGYDGAEGVLKRGGIRVAVWNRGGDSDSLIDIGKPNNDILRRVRNIVTSLPVSKVGFSYEKGGFVEGSPKEIEGKVIELMRRNSEVKARAFVYCN